MNKGLTYNKFYDVLLNLREEFHTNGRIDDSNAKLDEIMKVLVVSYYEARRGNKFSLDYIKDLSVKKYGNSDNTAKTLRELFEEITKDAMFFNEDGTNIFGANPSLIIQESENQFADKLITELSGGQLQRVFLAKIFAQDPDIILLDEPTNHLDFKHQIELLENLSEWVKKNNKIVIGVLHDLNLVQYFADNVLMIKSGKGVSYGKPEDVFKRDVLNDIYGIDIKEFMLNILEKWA